MNLNWGFLKFQVGNRFREKNQYNTNTSQICFETFNSFQVWYEMYLNWGFLKFKLGNQVREKIKITQIQPRFVSKLSTHLKFGMTCA